VVTFVSSAKITQAATTRAALLRYAVASYLSAGTDITLVMDLETNKNIHDSRMEKSVKNQHVAGVLLFYYIVRHIS